MGQFQYVPLGIMCIYFDRGIRLNDLIQTAWDGVNSTIIQCVHEQSYRNMHISCLLFASNGSPIYKSLTKTKNTQSLKPMKH